MSKIPVRGSRASGLPRPSSSSRLPKRNDPRRSDAFQPDRTYAIEPDRAYFLHREETQPASRSSDFGTELKVGDTVLVNGESGTLRYLGETTFAEGVWAGVDLARPIGKNDGSVNGRRYFFCQRQHGLFAPLEKVVKYDPVPPPPASPPLPVTPKRCVEKLNLTFEQPVGVSATSTPILGAAAAITSPPEELWWDGDTAENMPEPDLAEEIMPDEHLQDLEDEFSLGILTAEQMDAEMGSMFRSEDFSRSLDLLSPPATAADGVFGEQFSPTVTNKIFTTDNAPACAALPEENATNEQQHPDVPMTVEREQEWEDEFDEHHLRTYQRTTVEEMLSDPVITSQTQSEEGKFKLEDSSRSDNGMPSSATAFISTSTANQDATTRLNNTLTSGDITTSMSSESSDVTVKNVESSGAGEALLEPPSARSVESPAVVVVPDVRMVDEIGCMVVTSVMTEEISDDVTPMDVDTEKNAISDGLQQPAPPEIKKEVISEVGAERVKSVVFSEPEVPPDGSRVAAEGGACHDLTRAGEPTGCCATSTTSIDGGYQGDSEFDTGTPSEEPARAPPRLDVLTDSDFCSEGAAGTESEAEHRLTDVDMESSGVYSDAESRRSAEPDREPIEAIAETEETVLSPVRETPSELEPTSAASSPTHSASISVSASASASASAAEPPPPTRGRGARPRDPIPSHVVKPRETPPKKEPIKMNHPLPRRNVQSKLRTMLEAPPTQSADAARRPPRTPRKGRWDAVMKGIEKGKSEEKTRPRREVKSRVFEGISTTKDGAPLGHRRSGGAQQSSRPGSAHTLTGSRTSLRPSASGSRSVSPTCSEVSSQSSGSGHSRGSMHSRGSHARSARSAAGSNPNLVSGRMSLIPALRRTQGSASTTARSGGKQPAAPARSAVAASATRAALSAAEPRRKAAVLANKTNIANNNTQGTRASKSTSRPPTGTRSQNKVQNKSTPPKDAKPVPLKPSSPSVAAAAAAARHEVQVSQLEAQVAGQQQDLHTARTDLQHAARCFDAAMVMVNYISKEYNPFQLTEEVKALQIRATEIQLKLDEAAATQRRLEETLNEREAARQQRETEHESELTTLQTSHQEALQARQQEITEVRDAWHRERELQESELARQQQQRDDELRSLAAQHQQTLSSVAQQWERELSDSQQRAQQDADQLRAQIDQLQLLNEELTRREDELKAAMGQSTNTKIQVLSARVKEKEKDVRSLNAVLELKKEEIASLRRDQHELQQLRDHKAKLEEHYTKALAKAEDLEAQLRQRCVLERQLSEENARLRDHQDRESKANKRLSMENEQLQYKLSEISHCSSPGVLSRSASFRSARTSVSRMCSSDSAHAHNRVSPRSPLKSESLRRRSRRSEEASPPPQVTAVVEKSDSISWVLDLERSPSRRGSSAEPDDGAGAGDSPALTTYGEWRRSLRGASRSPPSANGGGSESSDSELAEHEPNGVFYHLGAAPATHAGGVASAPCSLTPPGAAPGEPSIAEVPETVDGTEI